jgi:hypothetical protein
VHIDAAGGGAGRDLVRHLLQVGWRGGWVGGEGG